MPCTNIAIDRDLPLLCCVVGMEKWLLSTSVSNIHTKNLRNVYFCEGISSLFPNVSYYPIEGIEMKSETL